MAVGEEPVDEAVEPQNAYEKRIAALEATISKDRQTRANNELKATIKETVKANSAKYPNIAADEALSQDVVQYLLQFTMQTGKPPGDTLDESIQMAAEAVEAREEAAAQKYLKRKGLTAPKASSTVTEVPKSAVEQPASELGSSRKTLTNSHASSSQAAGLTRPETVEDLHAKALKMLEAQG